MHDSGGRRLGIDRRQISYHGHVPEMRCGLDRRSAPDRRTETNRRRGINRRESHKEGVKVLDLRTKKDRRVLSERRAALS
jgi:hypothetical protein